VPVTELKSHGVGGPYCRRNQALSLYKPDVVIIELAANDSLRGLPPILIKSNLAETARRAKLAGAKVLLLFGHRRNVGTGLQASSRLGNQSSLTPLIQFRKKCY